jgi:hypothetical protein
MEAKGGGVWGYLGNLDDVQEGAHTRGWVTKRQLSAVGRGGQRDCGKKTGANQLCKKVGLHLELKLKSRGPPLTITLLFHSRGFHSRGFLTGLQATLAL